MSRWQDFGKEVMMYHFVFIKNAYRYGIGEKLTFIEQPFECKILLVKTKKAGVSTKNL